MSVELGDDELNFHARRRVTKMTLRDLVEKLNDLLAKDDLAEVVLMTDDDDEWDVGEIEMVDGVGSSEGKKVVIINSLV